ncbi:MAG: amidohydrolase family protein, partial [Actinobacteria bacterium]|nr:amidohydrolase family protein [Actinomycetota bacterium]
MIKIRNVNLVDGSIVNVEIDQGLVKTISKSTGKDNLEGIDGAGKILMPGLVDLHTHLREPGREDSETVLTGSESAVTGGFTA